MKLYYETQSVGALSAWKSKLIKKKGSQWNGWVRQKPSGRKATGLSGEAISTKQKRRNSSPLQVGGWSWLVAWGSDYPPSLSSNLVSSSWSCSGSFSKVGGGVVEMELWKLSLFAGPLTVLRFPPWSRGLRAWRCFSTHFLVCLCAVQTLDILSGCALLFLVFRCHKGKSSGLGRGGGMSVEIRQCMHVRFGIGRCGRRLPCCFWGFWSGGWGWTRASLCLILHICQLLVSLSIRFATALRRMT